MTRSNAVDRSGRRRIGARLLAGVLMFGVAAAAAPASTASPLAEHPSVAGRLALFEIWVDQQRRHLDQPGVSIGIVHDQELVWAKGFGLADLAAGRPATPQTVFRIGSITKTFTATALLQLRDAGKLSLDDPVRRHLPWFGVRGPTPEGPEITVRHLLTHTAGLPRDAPFPYWTDREFPTREALAEAVREGVALFEPGAGYEYSNLGIALAGEVVAAASGMPWEEYLQRHVLAPLGMDSTSAAGPRTPPERLATGYLTRPPDGAPPLAPPTVSRALAPAAEMASTVEDLARFVSAHLARPGAAGSTLLSPATRREMHRVHWLSPSWTSGRGLGFSVWRQGDRTLVGHAGWVAGHRAQIAFDPESRIGIVVLTNSDQGGPASYVRQAFELIAPAIEKLTAPAAEVPEAEDPERFAGTYQTPWGEVTDVLVLDGGLVMYDRSHPPAENIEGSLTKLIPEGGTAFRMATDDDTGSRVVFELDGGRVVRVQVGENYLFPQDCGRLGPDLRCTWADEER